MGRLAKEEKRACFSNKQSLETRLNSAETKKSRLAAYLDLEKQLREKLQVELDQAKIAARQKSSPPREKDSVEHSQHSRSPENTGDKPKRESVHYRPEQGAGSVIPLS